MQGVASICSSGGVLMIMAYTAVIHAYTEARLHIYAVKLFTVYVLTQVFSTQQWATMIVHSYPFFPSLETFLDSIGARHNEPSLQQILTTAPASPMTQEMIALDEYVRFVCDGYRHDSVPVPRAATGTLSCFSQPASAGSSSLAKPSASLRDMMLY
jgi:hypothetical protein